MKKRALALLLALALGMSLAACGGDKKPDPTKQADNPPVSSDEVKQPVVMGEPTTVPEKLLAATSMTNEELYAKAKEEKAAGARLDFYSTTSFAEKAAENFMNDYPDLAGMLFYAEIDDGETYSLLTKTIGTGVKDSADMGLTQNGSDLKTYLLDEGLAYTYFPNSMKSVVPEQYQSPAVVTFINSLFIYNNSTGPIDFDNVWQLTEPQWTGKVFFKDPTNETVNINFLIQLTSDEWTERMEKAYEAQYGKAWSAADSEFESASYEWIDKFLKNVNYTYTSASKMAAGIASGAGGNLGLFVFSKLRKVDEADRGNLTVSQFEKPIEGFAGFMYSIYATVFQDTDCPYTCALFINYLLDEAGFAGPKSWNSSQGYYSPNTTIEKPDGIEDEAYNYWAQCLVVEDQEFIYDNYAEVYEFISVRVGG